MINSIEFQIEGLTEACKHTLIGLELKFKHTWQPKDLDELLKAVIDVMYDAKSIETRYRDALADHMYLKAKLNEVIEDIMNFKKEVQVRFSEGYSEIVNEILSADSDWRKAGIVGSAEEAEAE